MLVRARLPADLLSCVGAVAGLRAVADRPPARPVPILAFHGTADRVNPYAGGTTPLRTRAPRRRRALGRRQRRPATADRGGGQRDTDRTTYGTPGGDGEITLWTAAGAGHTWPGSHLGIVLRLLLGRTNMEIDATKEIWDFAGRHVDDP